MAEQIITNNKIHCASCGKVICSHLDGVVNLYCPKCKRSNMAASFKDNEGVVRYIIWQTNDNNESVVCSYIQDFFNKT